MRVRKPAKAGSWYPGTERGLRHELAKYFNDGVYGVGHDLIVGDGERTVCAVVCPHAGYTYSAPAATWSYDAIFSERLPDTVVILGTRHTAYFGIATQIEGAWDTPIGRSEIDGELASALVDASGDVKDDTNAFFGYPHGLEHNIELQVPFIQVASLDIKIVPVKLGVEDWETISSFGETLGRVVKEAREGGKDVVVVASSDMTHSDVNSERQKRAMFEKDSSVMDAVKRLDPEAAFRAARETTVCGPQTISAAMVASRVMGASRGEVLKYYTSHDITGSSSGYCVGYMSAVFR
ncbi:MAG: AmmeMemoRadiSam system protein B [Promethearchaeota archaeon]